MANGFHFTQRVESLKPIGFTMDWLSDMLN